MLKFRAEIFDNEGSKNSWHLWGTAPCSSGELWASFDGCEGMSQNRRAKGKAKGGAVRPL
jgi:hypothetical protein